LLWFLAAFATAVATVSTAACHATFVTVQAAVDDNSQNPENEPWNY